MIPGTKLRVDLLCLSPYGDSEGVMVEVSPGQHDKFNKFFHGSLAGFRASLKRDLKKAAWAERNKLTYVELGDEDLKALSPQLFLDKFGLTL